MMTFNNAVTSVASVATDIGTESHFGATDFGAFDAIRDQPFNFG